MSNLINVNDWFYSPTTLLLRLKVPTIDRESNCLLFNALTKKTMNSVLLCPLHGPGITNVLAIKHEIFFEGFSSVFIDAVVVTML